MIIILGSPNNDRGELHRIAKERCEKAIKIFKQDNRQMFILTGGFGDHFNRTDKPHALYLKNYLLARGVPAKNILALVKSSNTIEDAILTKKEIDRHHIKKATIVTSDYHLPRVKYIFNRIFTHDIELTFSYSKTDVDECDLNLEALKDHEKKTLSTLKNQKILTS